MTLPEESNQLSNTRNKNKNPLKIVLVDDEPDVVAFLQTALEDNGYIALKASSAEEGLEIVRREKPALVCLDVLMPQESGVSLYAKIKTDPNLEKIPILISSGLNFNRDLKKMFNREKEDGTVISGPENIIEKPIDIDQFLAVVRRLTS